MPQASDITVTFASRQTADSTFSHFDGTDAELIDLILQAWDRQTPGYRDGVIEVPVDPDRFYSNVVRLQEGDKLTGEYTARRTGEDPRKRVGTPADGRGKMPAAAVSIILYREDVLAEEEGYVPASLWEVISINARTTEGPEPMTPGTAMANHFGGTGGTDTKMSDAEFVAFLRTCWIHWRDKAPLMGD